MREEMGTWQAFLTGQLYNSRLVKLTQLKFPLLIFPGRILTEQSKYLVPIPRSSM
jgi:hypothetical protein